MFNQLLFFITFTTFGTGMFIFYIFYFLIFAVIVSSVIRAIIKGVKAAKESHNSNDIFVSVDEFDKNSAPAKPDHIACEYCGFVNPYESSKCSCCGAPIKHKNVK